VWGEGNLGVVVEKVGDLVKKSGNLVEKWVILWKFQAIWSIKWAILGDLPDFRLFNRNWVILEQKLS
jgi:hypothetical protein